MRQFFAQNPDHVKPARRHRPMVCADIKKRRADDAFLFCRRDRLGRIAIFCTSAVFYFHKYETVAVSGYDVDLALSAPVIPLQNDPALLL